MLHTGKGHGGKPRFSYHNRVIDALQVIEELIKIGRDLQQEPDDGLTPEEVAFYDALAENGSATELMGNAELRLIASELVKDVRENGGMDWRHFHQRRKKLRTTIRRILRKYGYPPDLASAPWFSSGGAGCGGAMNGGSPPP